MAEEQRFQECPGAWVFRHWLRYQVGNYPGQIADSQESGSANFSKRTV